MQVLKGNRFKWKFKYTGFTSPCALIFAGNACKVMRLKPTAGQRKKQDSAQPGAKEQQTGMQGGPVGLFNNFKQILFYQTWRTHLNYSRFIRHGDHIWTISRTGHDGLWWYRNLRCRKFYEQSCSERSDCNGRCLQICKANNIRALESYAILCRGLWSKPTCLSILYWLGQLLGVSRYVCFTCTWSLSTLL